MEKTIKKIQEQERKHHEYRHRRCISQPTYSLPPAYCKHAITQCHALRHSEPSSSDSSTSIDVLLGNLSLRASLRSDLLSVDHAVPQDNCSHEKVQHDLSASVDYLKSVQTQTDDNHFTRQLSKKMHQPDAQGDGINVGQQTRKSSHVDQVHGDGDCKQGDLSIDEFTEKNLPENHMRLPDWDLRAVETPIENGEWIAFLQKSMEEIMEGDIDSMLQQNCVSVFVSPLRNPAANCRVIEFVACLLALPFTVSVSQTNLKKIEKVYLDVRVIPNLIYAIKLLMLKCSDSESYAADKVNNATMRSASSLSADELQALERVLLVVCRLVYIEDQFLMQFCNAIYIVNGVPFLQELLTLEKRKTRIVTDLVAILNNVLRSQPENAELVERVVLRTKTPGEPINKLDVESPTIPCNIVILGISM